MPTHCCVPECTKKGYRDEDGNKVSYFIFPSDKLLRKKWLHAIKRDEGKYFTVNESTKVCSRHFREGDLKNTLAGKLFLKAGSVPSVFPWIRTSPRKRKLPTARALFAESSTCINSRDEANDMAVVPEEPDIQERRSLTKDAEIQTDSTNDELLVKEVTANLNERIRSLEKQVSALRLQVEDGQQKNKTLKARCFTIESFKSKDSAAAFYTGFPNWDTFMALFRYLDPGEKGENIKYWLSSNTSSSTDHADDKGSSTTKKGRSRSLRAIDEYFLVMCRLRQDFAEEHLATLFGISVSTVSRIFITWINFMYLKLGQINIWPSREIIDETMPADFKINYSFTRVIIDCTEVRCQMPSSLHLNGELFNNYKNHTTLKSLVGISPGGAITFISQLYTGSISDREIVIRSGFLDLPFSNGDSVMADKGFTIEDLLPLGVSLNIPPFLGGSNQMAAKDVVKTQEIASLRIHIERAINKIKNFHVWDKVIPLHQFGLVNQMWSVCAFLCNAQCNIISV